MAFSAAVALLPVVGSCFALRLRASGVLWLAVSLFSALWDLGVFTIDLGLPFAAGVARSALTGGRGSAAAFFDRAAFCGAFWATAFPDTWVVFDLLPPPFAAADARATDFAVERVASFGLPAAAFGFAAGAIEALRVVLLEPDADMVPVSLGCSVPYPVGGCEGSPVFIKGA